MIGSTLSHYLIEAELGRGGMGIVYKARDTKLDRDVALKFLADHLTGDETARERFVREARAVAMLRHDNICAIHDVQETDGGHVFIVMPLYEGRSLKEMLTGGPLSEEKALTFARQIASGLKAAHAKDLTHRDIKPANLWVTDDERIKILDFGLAKLTGEQDLTKTSSTVGTMAYMAPEQVQNHLVDSRADLWSLGIVLYEMLVGRRPFTGEYEAAVVYGIVNQEPDLDEVPRDARALVRRLLAKDPEARYQRIENVVAAIDGLLVIDSLGSTIAEEVGSISPLPGWWKPAAGVVVLVLGALAWTILSSGGDQNREASRVENLPTVPTVGVMYIENNTERARFGRTVQSMLARNLAQADSINVISDQRLQDILRMELGGEFETVDAASASLVARQAGISTMIIGSVTQLGSQIVLAAELTDVASGNILDAVSVTTTSEEGVLDALNELTHGILRGSGKSGAAESGLIRIQDVATDNFTAYEYYEQGMDHLNRWRFSSAATSFEQAIDRDSTFFAAHLGLFTASTVFSFRPDDSLIRARQILEAAGRHVDHATEKEKDELRLKQQRLERGFSLQPDDLAIAMAEKYPDDKYLQYEAGLYSGWDRAMEYYRKAVDLDPTFGLAYNMLAYSNVFQGNIDEALSNTQRYRSLQPDVVNAMDTSFEVMLAGGREQAALLMFDEALASGISEYQVAWRRMYAHALIADTAAAWQDLQRVKATAESGTSEFRFRLYEAPLLLMMGQWERARIASAAFLREARRTVSDEVLLRYLRRHGMVLHAMGQHDDAERHFAEMVEISLQVTPEGFNPFPFFSAHDQATYYADAGHFERALSWLDVMDDALQNPAYGLDQRHEGMADLVRNYVILNRDGTAALADQPVDDILTTVNSFAMITRAWQKMDSGDKEGAKREMALVEHNVSSKNFEVAGYITFMINSPTARYRTGQMFEAFEMKEEAIEAYESAMERFEQTGATFKYVALTRERLEALRGME